SRGCPRSDLRPGRRDGDAHPRRGRPARAPQALDRLCAEARRHSPRRRGRRTRRAQGRPEPAPVGRAPRRGRLRCRRLCQLRRARRTGVRARPRELRCERGGASQGRAYPRHRTAARLQGQRRGDPSRRPRRGSAAGDRRLDSPPMEAPLASRDAGARVEVLTAAARAAARTLAGAPASAKDAALREAATRIRAAERALLDANRGDAERAKTAGESAAFVERLTLTPARIEAMARGLEDIAALPDPIDVVIARGGEQLKRTVLEESRIPVVKHFEGICHLYVDAAADLAMAERICLNAKVQRPSVCNAIENLLVHEQVAARFLPGMV